MKKEELKTILENHKKWLNNEEGGVRVNLSGADLSDADLSDANLSDANLRGANLSGVNLRGADLSDANLRGANLSGVNLRGADLSDADLSDANLSDANLRGANLRGANLSGVNLRGADLSDAKNLLSSINYLDANFEKTADGYVAYKTFNSQYEANKEWEIKPSSIINEVVNPNRQDVCGCGINVAPIEWVKDNYKGEIWKVLVRWEWLTGVIVPYNTDGKIRCERVELIEIAEVTK